MAGIIVIANYRDKCKVMSSQKMRSESLKFFRFSGWNKN